jgi:phosphate transport system substrate-binding protein
MLVLTMIVPQSLGFAQDDETTTIVVAGSFQTQIQAVLEGVRDSFVADNADVDIQLALEGSEVGLRSLCAGEADLAVSTEPIGEALSATELANCVNQGPNFIETVLAYDAVVLVAPTSAQAICLPQEQAAADTPANSISGLWSLGSPAEIPWTNLGSTLESNIQFYGTADYTLAYQTFSNVLAAGDLRDDITVADPAAIIAAVQAENSSVMGFMSLSDWQQVNPADGSVTEVGILDTDTAGCVNPSVETIEARTYPLTRTVYLYVNADSVEKVQPFVEFALTNEQGVTAQAPAQGFTLPSETTLQTRIWRRFARAAPLPVRSRLSAPRPINCSARWMWWAPRCSPISSPIR